MASKGAEYKAGIIVLLGLIVLGVGLFLVSGGADQFKDKKIFTILFKNGGGIGGGDSVYLAGRKVGKVTSVREREDVMDGKKGTFVVVEVLVFEDSRVHRDSPCSVSKTVTGIVTLNLEYGQSNELAPAGSKLKGRKLASFEDAIDEGKLLIEDGRRMVQQIERTLVELHKDVEDLDISGLRERVVTLLDSLNDTARDIDKLVEHADEKVSTVLDTTDGGMKEFKGLATDLRRDWKVLEESLRNTMGRIESAAGKVDGILEENRPNLKLAIQGLADASRKFVPTMAQIHRLVQSVDSLVLDVSPKLSSGLRAASTAFKNFRALTEDLKTAPWKLINEPSYKETIEIHLYNAARNFVKSAEEIQDVLDELDTLRKNEDFQRALEDEKMKKRIDDLTAKLQLTLKLYDTREKELVKLISKARKEK